MEYAIELRVGGGRERERDGGVTWWRCHLVTLCSVDGRWMLVKYCWRGKPSTRTTCTIASLPTTNRMALDRTRVSVETGQRLTAWTLTWRYLFYWWDPWTTSISFLSCFILASKFVEPFICYTVQMLLINLLKHTGYVMHQQFNIQQLYVLPTLYFYVFLFIWEKTATCATYSINWLVFITEMKSVYYAVRTGSLNKAVCVFKGLSSSPSSSGALLVTLYFPSTSVFYCSSWFVIWGLTACISRCCQ
jgi:hypothetical protein